MDGSRMTKTLKDMLTFLNWTDHGGDNLAVWRWSQIYDNRLTGCVAFYRDPYGGEKPYSLIAHSWSRTYKTLEEVEEAFRKVYL